MTSAAVEQKRLALEAVGKIPGWLSLQEAALLYDLAVDSPGPIVEIGSYQGRSTAALSLGSKAGQQQTVYAIDSFLPVLQTSTGKWSNESSLQLLIANLEQAAALQLVEIIPHASEVAAKHVPNCGLLFVDGAHDYESVRRDLELYLPKVQLGGHVVIHDCHEADPGVVQAVDEIITANPAQWRCRWRADTAVVFERRNSVRHKIMLAFPGSNLCFGAAKGLMQATLGAHDVELEQSGMGWDDMNRLWVHALNRAYQRKVTHFAMLHSDITPSPGWIDLLADELDARDGDLISAVAALKNEQGLTSCGIGAASNPWQPLRRLTMHELMAMPETFGITQTEHPQRYLLHNTGCWLADLRKPLWRTVDENNCLVADLSFPIRGRVLPSGEIVHERESEDWHFSRKMAELGAKTFVTRRVSTIHFGQKGFRNDHAWGTLEHDEATREKWEPDVQKPAAN